MGQQLPGNLPKLPLRPGVNPVDLAGLSLIQNIAIGSNGITHIQKVALHMPRGDPECGGWSFSPAGRSFTAHNMLRQ